MLKTILAGALASGALAGGTAAQAHDFAYPYGYDRGVPAYAAGGYGGAPAETRESKAMSEALRVRGFAFAGPTICYAFMQAAGMVDDHLLGCFRHTSRRTS